MLTAQATEKMPGMALRRQTDGLLRMETQVEWLRAVIVTCPLSVKKVELIGIISGGDILRHLTDSMAHG